VHTSPESNKDDVFMQVYVDGVMKQRWPDNNSTVAMGDGGVADTDVDIHVDYSSTVHIEVKERDSSNNTSSTIVPSEASVRPSASSSGATQYSVASGMACSFHHAGCVIPRDVAPRASG